MANPVAFGKDVHCVDEYVPGRMATGVQLVAQRCYHRLITPSGVLRGGEDERNFGLDLASFVGGLEERDVRPILPVRVANELLKDETVDAVKVDANRVENAGRVSWSLLIRVTSNVVDDFDLIVTVDEVSVELLGVR